MSSKKLPVSLNIFPTLDYIELIQYDEKTGEIEKTASLPCQFDQISRQMADRDQMAQTIRDLYNLNRIPFVTPAVLILPSFFTREIELPAEFTKDELRFALVSEAERFYIFKKVEPQIDWINLDESRLLYSAFPKTEIEKYTQIFQELRIPLLGIELNYFSILRGLVSTGAVSEEIDSQARWCLLVISDNSFYTSIQQGLQIQKTADAPLSVTAEDDQGVIQEIQQDFETFTEMEAFGKLVIVNNASRISSDTLINRLSFQGSLIVIDQNALTLRSRGVSEGQFPCTLEGIGGVFYTELAELPRMNFVSDTAEDVVGIMNYRKEAFKWLLIADGAVFVLCLLLWAVLALIIWQKDEERNRIIANMAKLGASANAEQVNEINRKKYIKKIVDQNVRLNNFMVRLGSMTTGEVWLEKVELTLEKPEDPVKVNLEGKAMTLDPVNRLPAQLNSLLQNGDLEVSNAAPAATEDGQSYFTWGIQNKAAGGASSASPGQGGG